MNKAYIEVSGIVDSYIFHSSVEERLQTKSTLYSI